MTYKVGEAIKHARELRGHTQERLADIVGVTTQAVCRYELGQSSPSLFMLFAFASALGVEFVVTREQTLRVIDRSGWDCECGADTWLTCTCFC